MDFLVIKGDIADERADVLVNAAGTSLEMGSGVAGALRRAAGGPINEDAVSKGPIELGEVTVTDAYGLDADHVIHAAAMPHYGDGRASADSIRDATRNSLEAVDEMEYTSMVLPVLGTGAAGFAFEDGAQIVCETVWEYEPDTLEDVHVIAYSDDEYRTLREIDDEIRTL